VLLPKWYRYQIEERLMSPAKSEKQRRAAAADYERMKEGKPPRTFKGASKEEVHHFMKKAKGKK
jgi:hypothetical protein